MKSTYNISLLIIMVLILCSCSHKEISSDMNIIYLHHSTGGVIWYGKDISLITKVAKKINNRFAEIVGTKAQLPLLINNHNKEYGRNYSIKEMEFPKAAPYGWNNNPYDYYNIWVKNSGNDPYKEEPTLEILTKDYQIIIFKHCFPVSNIQPDQDSSDINSPLSTISNFKLQYTALRNKINEFPDTKFILFTGAAQVKSNITRDEAERARVFFTWVINEWDVPNDNIYIWDLYNLETEGGLFFLEEYAVSPNDPHPNGDFAGKAVKLLFNRIIDIIETEGKGTTLTGEKN